VAQVSRRDILSRGCPRSLAPGDREVGRSWNGAQPQKPARRRLCPPAPTNSLYNGSSFTTGNQINSTTVNSATYTYDLAGNVINDGTNHYVYDPEGRLCAVWSPGPVYTQYVYDANGQRVAKGTIPATDWPALGATCNAPTAANGFTLTAQYLRGQSGDQDIELTGTGQLAHQNIFEGGGLAATYWNYNSTAVPEYELSYNFSDWLGTKRLQTNNNPSPETYWRSDPFGNYLTPYGTEADATGTTAPIHFTGKERDAESGNDYFGARYYASSMGRWMSPDESLDGAIMELPQTWNKYSYEYNRPTYGTDPDGRCPPCAGAIIGGVVEGGFDAGKQFIQNGYSFNNFNRQEFFANVAGGAVSGAIAGATGGASIVANAFIGDVAAGATGNIIGGVVTRALTPNTSSSEVLSAGNVSEDAIAGFVGGAGGNIASSFVHVPEEPTLRMRSTRQFKTYARESEYFQKYGGRNQAITNQFTRAGLTSSVSTHSSNGLVDWLNRWFFNGPHCHTEETSTTITDRNGNVIGASTGTHRQVCD